MVGPVLFGLLVMTGRDALHFVVDVTTQVKGAVVLRSVCEESATNCWALVPWLGVQVTNLLR